MIELSTGYLNFEQLDAEVLAIIDDLHAFGVETAYVTLGAGCRLDEPLQWKDVPVPTTGLAQFIADCEADEVFELGASNLCIRGAGIEFLLCHEHDVHCSGNESPRLLAVRKRWTRDYEHSYERRSGGRWHRLTGRPKDTRDP